MTATIQATVTLPEFREAGLSRALIGDLRSDHAGETGAVCIYEGLLDVERDPAVRRFALDHLKTELEHLAFFEQWMPREHRSRFLPLWRFAGRSLGKIASRLGPRWVYVTIDAVETFVVRHYEEQIHRLEKGDETHQAIAIKLREFQEDESHHREDAANRALDTRNRRERCWAAIVDLGSRAAVGLAKRA